MLQLLIFAVSTTTLLMLIWSQIKATPVKQAKTCNPSTFVISRGSRRNKCNTCKIQSGFVPSK